MRNLLVCLVALLLVAACRSGGSEEALRKGNKLLNSKNPQDWEKAVPYFKETIRLEIEARTQLARAYKKIARDKLLKGDSILNSAADKRKAATLRSQLGSSLATFEIYYEALSNLEAAVAITPNDKFLHYYLGVCHGQLSRSRKTDGEAFLEMEQAIQAYRTALRLDSDFTDALYGLAMVYLAKGDYKEGVKYVQQVLQKEPKNTRARFALAQFYFRLKQYARAESVYRQLLELLPRRSHQRKIIKQNLRKLEVMRTR